MQIVLGPAFWALGAVSLAAALAYGFLFLNKPPTLLRAAVKTLFMAALAAAFASANAPPPLIAALVCAALGDLFLAFDKTWTLGLGILSFLLMQLLYTLIFFGLWMLSGDNSPLWPRYAMMGVIVLVSVGFLIWLKPSLRSVAIGIIALTLIPLGTNVAGLYGPIWVGLLSLPCTVALFILDDIISSKSKPPSALMQPTAAVVTYALAIMVMVCMAMWLPWAGWAAMLGALSFLISDGVLSAELFKLPPDAPVRRITAPVVWWTYAAAQVLIVIGMVQAAAVMN